MSSIIIFSIYNPRTLRCYTTSTVCNDIKEEIQHLRKQVKPYLNGQMYIDDLTLEYHPFLSILLCDSFQEEIHDIIQNSPKSAMKIDTLVAYNQAMMLKRLRAESRAESVESVEESE